MAGVDLGSTERAIFDLQNETRTSRVRHRPLSDLEFVAHHYNHLAVAHFLHERYAPARSAIDHALALSSQTASFLNNRATITAAEGDLAIAVAEASHAVRLSPDVPLYRYQLGRLLLASARLADAIEQLRYALSLRSRYGLARRDLGWALLLSGSTAPARQHLQRAMRDDPRTPDIHLYVALFHQAQGDAKAARSTYEAGLKRSPDNPNLMALGALLDGDTTSPAVVRLQGVLKTVRRTP